MYLFLFLIYVWSYAVSVLTGSSVQVYLYVGFNCLGFWFVCLYKGFDCWGFWFMSVQRFWLLRFLVYQSMHSLKGFNCLCFWFICLCADLNFSVFWFICLYTGFNYLCFWFVCLYTGLFVYVSGLSVDTQVYLFMFLVYLFVHRFISIKLPQGARKESIRFRWWQPENGGPQMGDWIIDGIRVNGEEINPSRLTLNFSSGFDFRDMVSVDNMKADVTLFYSL